MEQTLKICDYPKDILISKLTQQGELLSIQDFRSVIKKLTKESCLSENTCLQILDLYKDSYEALRFLWCHTHPSFIQANTKIMKRMIEIVSRDNVEDLVSLQRILPIGMSVIDPIKNKKAYELYITTKKAFHKLNQRKE